MAFSNAVRDRWRAAECAFGFWTTVGSGFLVEIVARARPDWIGIDMQHGLISFDAMTQMTMAAWANGAVPIVRPAANDRAEIGRVLDAGALGVVIPMVGTAEAATQAVLACRYAPRGSRSFGPTRAFAGGTDPQSLEQVLCFAMIETVEGVENVEKIVATGIDGILLGPTDLALDMGLGPYDRPAEHVAAIDRIVRACRDAGVVVGQVVGNGEQAAGLARAGYRLVGYGGDSVVIESFSNRELAVARAWRQ